MHCKVKKELYAPDYYSRFKCTADKCRHSCCIDWEICIDDNALEKYKSIPDIISTVEYQDDGACFRLSDCGRCPHLDENGLCNIIISHGEELLSDICKNHPRFFNDISKERREAGIGIVCEEACRLIVENDAKLSLAKIGEIYETDEADEAMHCDGQNSNGEFCIINLRDRVFNIINEHGTALYETVHLLKSEFSINDIHTMSKWLDILLNLEILDTAWVQKIKNAKNHLCSDIPSSILEYDKYYTRLLAYFVYRHVSTAKGYDDMRARLAFAILSVQIIKHLFEIGTEHSLGSLIDTARSYSAEIEYSEDNTAELIFEFESEL